MPDNTAIDKQIDIYRIIDQSGLLPEGDKAAYHPKAMNQLKALINSEKQALLERLEEIAYCDAPMSDPLEPQCEHLTHDPQDYIEAELKTLRGGK